MVFSNNNQSHSANKDKQGSPPEKQMKMVQDITNLNRRIRVLEERYNNLRNKNQLTDQNMLKYKKEFNRKIDVNNQDLKEMRREISEIKDKMSIVVKELKLLAKKEDMEVLKKYIEMWEPVEFVTQDQVRRIVQDMIEEYKQKG